MGGFSVGEYGPSFNRPDEVNSMQEHSNGKGTDANAILLAVHDSMLDGLGQLSDYFGFSKVMGQIFGALLLSTRPLCLDDFVERLDISKASASMNIRTLENMGMVRQVWVRGSRGRRKFYEAESDFLQILTNILQGREMRDVERALAVMSENADALRATMPMLDDDDREMATLYFSRIAQMRGLFQFAQLMITTVLARMSEINVRDISRIEIE